MAQRKFLRKYTLRYSCTGVKCAVTDNEKMSGKFKLVCMDDCRFVNG